MKKAWSSDQAFSLFSRKETIVSSNVQNGIAGKRCICLRIIRPPGQKFGWQVVNGGVREVEYKLCAFLPVFGIGESIGLVGDITDTVLDPLFTNGFFGFHVGQSHFIGIFVFFLDVYKFSGKSASVFGAVGITLADIAHIRIVKLPDKRAISVKR